MIGFLIIVNLELVGAVERLDVIGTNNDRLRCGRTDNPRAQSLQNLSAAERKEKQIADQTLGNRCKMCEIFMRYLLPISFLY
jgi:hypothetical protein